MLISGDVLAVVAVIVGLCVSITALLVGAAVLFAEPVERSRAYLAAAPWKALGWGAITGVVAGLLALALAQSPNGLVRLIGMSASLALLALTLVGAAGLVSLLAERIGANERGIPRFGLLLRAGGLLSVACLVPAAGWFLVAPTVGLAGLGAGAYALLGRRTAPAPAAATAETVAS